MFQDSNIFTVLQWFPNSLIATIIFRAVKLLLALSFIFHFVLSDPLSSGPVFSVDPRLGRWLCAVQQSHNGSVVNTHTHTHTHTWELSIAGKSYLNGPQSDIRFETRTNATLDTLSLHLIYLSITIWVHIIKTLSNKSISVGGRLGCTHDRSWRVTIGQ